MRQQVIYSMLAMAAVPAVSMAQVAQDEAIVTAIAQGSTQSQTITTAEINLNGDTPLAIGTYELTFSFGTPDGLLINGATVPNGSDKYTVELTEPGNITVQMTSGEGMLAISKAVVKFPQACVDYATAFTARYNEYGGTEDEMATAMRNEYSTQAARFLIDGGFNTYDNYVAMEMWGNNPAAKLTEQGDVLQKQIAKFMLDQVLPDYEEALEALDEAIAAAEEKLETLNPNDAAAEALQDKIDDYKEQRDNLEKQINQLVYGQEVTNENLEEPKEFTGTDDAFKFLTSDPDPDNDAINSPTDAVNALAEEVTNTMNEDIQEAKDAYTQFGLVQRWENEANDSLAKVQALFDELVEAKKIDVGKDDQGEYSFQNTLDVSNDLQEAAERIATFFDASKTATNQYSIGYRYYQDNANWSTWYAAGAAYTRGNEGDFTPYIKEFIAEIKADLLKGAEEYKAAVDSLADTLNVAVGTPTDLDDLTTGDATANSGAFKDNNDQISTNEALNFKVVNPSTPNAEATDIYAAWREEAAAALKELRDADSTKYGKLTEAYEAGTVGDSLLAGVFTEVNPKEMYDSVLFNGQGDVPFVYDEKYGYAVKADTLNKAYNKVVNAYASRITDLEEFWASIPDTVKAEWSGEKRGAAKGLDSLYAKLHNTADTGMVDTLQGKFVQAAYDSLVNHSLFDETSVFNPANQNSDYNDKMTEVDKAIKDFKEYADSAWIASAQYHWLADSTNALVEEVIKPKFDVLFPNGLTTNYYDPTRDDDSTFMFQHAAIMADSILKYKVGTVFAPGNTEYADFHTIDTVSIVEKHIAAFTDINSVANKIYNNSTDAFNQGVKEMDDYFLGQRDNIFNADPKSDIKYLTFLYTRLSLSDAAKEALLAAVGSIQKCADEYKKVYASLNETMMNSTDPSVLYKGKTYKENLDLIKKRIDNLIDSISEINASNLQDRSTVKEYTEALQRLLPPEMDIANNIHNIDITSLKEYTFESFTTGMGSLLAVAPGDTVKLTDDIVKVIGFKAPQEIIGSTDAVRLTVNGKVTTGDHPNAIVLLLCTNENYVAGSVSNLDHLNIRADAVLDDVPATYGAEKDTSFVFSLDLPALHHLFSPSENDSLFLRMPMNDSLKITSITFEKVAANAVQPELPLPGTFAGEVIDSAAHYGIRYDLGQLKQASVDAKEAFDLSQLKQFYNNKRSDLANRIGLAKLRVEKFRHDYLEDFDQLDSLGVTYGDNYEILDSGVLVKDLDARANDLWLEDNDSSALDRLTKKLEAENGSVAAGYINGMVASQWTKPTQLADGQKVTVGPDADASAEFELGFAAEEGQQIVFDVDATNDINIRVPGADDATTVDGKATVKVPVGGLEKNVKVEVSGVEPNVEITSIKYFLQTATKLESVIELPEDTKVIDNLNDTIKFKCEDLDSAKAGKVVRVELDGVLASGVQTEFKLNYFNGTDTLVLGTFGNEASATDGTPINNSFNLSLEQDLKDLTFILTEQAQAYRKLTLNSVKFTVMAGSAKFANVPGETCVVDSVYMNEFKNTTDGNEALVIKKEGGAWGVDTLNAVRFNAPIAIPQSAGAKVTITGQLFNDSTSDVHFYLYLGKKLETVTATKEEGTIQTSEKILMQSATSATAPWTKDTVITLNIPNNKEIAAGDQLAILLYPISPLPEQIHAGFRVSNVKFEFTEGGNEPVIETTDEGYNTIADYQEGIRKLQQIEDSLNDIIDDKKFDAANMTFTPTDIVTLEQDVTPYKTFVKFHNDNKKDILNKLYALKETVDQAMEDGKSYDYEVRQKFLGDNGLLTQVSDNLNGLIDNILGAKYEELFVTPEPDEAAVPDSARSGQYGLDRGLWSEGTPGTLSASEDTLSNDASFEGATAEELALIGKAAKITIEAMNAEKNNAEAIQQLSDLSTAAGDYIKARREGYNPQLVDYLLAAPTPFTIAADGDTIPALDILVANADTATATTYATPEAMDAAKALYNAQLDQLQDSLDKYRAILNTYTAEGAGGEQNTVPYDQAQNEEGTLYKKFVAIKNAADQVAADAHDNLVSFIQLYEQLNGNKPECVDSIWKKFQYDVDTAEVSTTTDQWKRVVSSFANGVDELLKEDGVTPDTIVLADPTVVAEYGEFYPNAKDRVTDSTLDGLKDWNDTLQIIFAEGRAGMSEADSQLVYRTHGEFEKLQDSLQKVWANINRADQVFLGNYKAQIEIDNNNVWAQVATAMKELREYYNEVKDSLQKFRIAAQPNDSVSGLLYAPAAKLDQALYTAANGITNSYNAAVANKAAADGKPELYDATDDLAAINGLISDIEHAYGTFLAEFFGALEGIPYGTAFDITEWKNQLEDENKILDVLQKRYISGDSALCKADSVFKAITDVTGKVADVLTKNAADLTPEDVEDIVAALNTYGGEKFAEAMDETLMEAAGNDKTRRIADLNTKLEQDKVDFIAAYHTESNDGQHDNMVSDADWKELKQDFDSIQAIADSAKLVVLNELPKDRDSMLTYIARYEVALGELKATADEKAEDYKNKNLNADLFLAKRDSIIARIDSALAAIDGAYIDEEFEPLFNEQKERIADNGEAISGLDKQDPVAIAKIDSIRGLVDTMIVAAYDAEQAKLAAEFNALYDDYNQIARDLNQALLDAQSEQLDNPSPENEAKVAAAQKAYYDFTESDDNGAQSYYEKVLEAKQLVDHDIAAPIDSADFADLDTLCNRESVIAELRNYLAATKAGKTVEEFNQQFIDQLEESSEAVQATIAAVVIGPESDYLGYDWKQIQAQKQDINTEKATVDAFIENHPKDIMMYVDQLEERLAGVLADVDDLEEFVAAAEARKAQSDKYKKLFNEYYTAEIAAYQEYAEYAQQGVADVTAFATLNDSVLINVMRGDLWQNQSLDGIIGTSANIASSQTRQINEYDSLTNIMPLDDVLAITTPSPVLSLGAGRYVPSLTTEQYNEALASIDEQLAYNKALIDAYKERAAHAVAQAYEAIGAMAFVNDAEAKTYLSLAQKRRQLRDIVRNANNATRIMYPATTIAKMEALLGARNDDASMHETSIRGAIRWLEDSIATSYNADPMTSLEDLDNHKAIVDDIVERLQEVEKMLESKLLGDLNGAVNPTYGDGGDGDITVTDLQILIDMALGKIPQPEAGSDLFGAADIDANGTIDINDVTCLANFILTGARYYDWDNEEIIRYARQANDRSERLSAVLVSNEDGQRTYAINLHSDKQYSAFQMDINLPEGMMLVGESLTSRANGHKLYNNDMQSTHRVLVHQFSNKNMTGNDGAVYTFTVQGEGELSFDNIIFSQADGQSRAFVIDGTTTGIVDKMQNMAVDAKETIYNVGGRVMSTLKKGVNIIRRDNGETEKVVK